MIILGCLCTGVNTVVNTHVLSASDASVWTAGACWTLRRWGVMAEKAECPTCGVYLSVIYRTGLCPNCDPQPSEEELEQQALEDDIRTLVEFTDYEGWDIASSIYELGREMPEVLAEKLYEMGWRK